MLEVDSSSNDVIPNYLEKKWSTVLRLQKRIMDLENDLKNLNSIMESQPSLPANTEKINWIPSSIKHTFKTLPNQQVTSVDIHPSLPLVVVGCSDGSIIVWNLASDDSLPEKLIKGHTRSVNKVVWSKSPIDIGIGEQEYVFASCSSDLSVKIWSGSTYKQVRNLLGHEHTVSHIEFSPSNPVILYSVSRDNCIKAWDLVTANCSKSFIGHSDWVRCVDVAGKESDYLLTCSNDQSIRLSHAESGTGLSLLIGHGHVVEAVKFLPSYSNKFIDLFLQKNTTRFPSLPTNLATDEIYNDLGFKYCISCGRDNSVKLWLLPPPILQPHRPPLPSSHNNSQGWLIDNLLGHTSWVKSLYIHPNGKYIFSCSDDKTIRIWDLETLELEGKVKCIRTLNGHEGFVTSISFAGFEVDDQIPTDPDQLMKYIETKMRCLFVSGGVDNTVRLWR